MVLSNTEIAMSVAMALLIAGFAAYLFWAQRQFAKLEAAAAATPPAPNTLPLKLGAYERLALFTERTRLDALVNRLYDASLSARQMQQVLTGAIKQEFEHNITQQIYVQPEVWEALTKMKDQNIYIINQLASLLPPQASALDLNKKILEYNLQDGQSTLNNLVLKAIRYETEKLLS